MKNRSFLLLISLIFVLFVSAFSVFAQNQNNKYDNKTNSRLKSMQQYRDTLKKNYTNLNNANVKKALDTTLKLLDEGINSGLDCVTKLDTNQKAECILTVKKEYAKAQVGYRLIKYYAILAGKKTTCVKADLGEKMHLKAHGITKLSERDAMLTASGTPNIKETGQTSNNRLFICGGNENSADSIQIKWRVQDRNGRFVPVTAEDKEKLGLGTDVNNLANKDHVVKALEELGI